MIQKIITPRFNTLRLSLLAFLAFLAVVSAASGQTPLGATIQGGGVQFAVFSEHATRMEIWIFNNAGDSSPASTHVMTKTDPINHAWTVTVNGAGAGTLYGIRAWGPNWTYMNGWTPGTPKAQDTGFSSHVDSSGNRFNPNKLLTDPYAKAVTGEPARVIDAGSGEERYDPSILGGIDAFGFLDSAGAMPKSIVIDDTYDWSADVRPQINMRDTVIYEVHLRGFTRAAPDVNASIQGTYAGFGAKAPYLAELGVNAAELLPIHEFLRFDDPVGTTEDRTNYWGYMSTQFFAPNYEYLCVDHDNCPTASGQQVTEFKDMVRDLHDEGIEVWLDVVYNHTAEGGGCAGNAMRYINFRGLDNQNYYTMADDKTCTWESTGTGNNLNASRPAVRRLILDSLRYWVEEMGVDGFRFDIAYTLGREGNDGRDWNPNAQTLIEIAQLAQDLDFDIVAEAWDVGGIAVGGFPAGWGEWNASWRDNVRRYVKSDAGEVGALGASITSTWSGMNPPEESVNFVTAHDGFTLNDLVSYNSKLNGVGPCNPTGADPNSGANSNESWDSAGDEILRRRQIRNFASHLLVHHGTPMITAGDEFRRTQYGNNNGYMADNSCGWINWNDKTTHAGTWEYFRALIDLRKNHDGLRRWTHVAAYDHDGDGYKDLTWHGIAPDTPDWSNGSRTIAYLIDGSTPETGGSNDAPDLYTAYNAFWYDVTFTLPTAPNGKCWYLAADTADWLENLDNVLYDPDVSGWNNQPLMRVNGSTWGVQSRSTLHLAARACSGVTESTLVTFEVNNMVTQVGEDIYVVGNTAELGNWNTANAVKLTWIDNDTWRGPVQFTTSVGQSVQYKYVKKSGGSVTWENGGNRSFTVPASGAGSRTDGWQY